MLSCFRTAHKAFHKLATCASSRVIIIWFCLVFFLVFSQPHMLIPEKISGHLSTQINPPNKNNSTYSSPLTGRRVQGSRRCDSNSRVHYGYSTEVHHTSLSLKASYKGNDTLVFVLRVNKEHVFLFWLLNLLFCRTTSGTPNYMSKIDQGFSRRLVYEIQQRT